MGRGKRNTSLANLTDEEELVATERFLGIWRMRMNKNKPGEKATLSDLLDARANGLKGLTRSPEDQKKVISSIRQCEAIVEKYSDSQELENQRLAVRAQRAAEQGRELFILCHRGYVDRLVAKHTLRFDSESPERASEILHQACNIALHRTIDRYSFDEAANPLTYATRVMLDEIKKEAEYGRRVRLKSKANALGDKIESLSKKIEGEGRVVTIAELAEKLEERPERIAEILPHARRNVISLDRQIGEGEEDGNLADIIADARVNTEGATSKADTEQRLLQALDNLPPLEKRVLEIAFDIGEGRSVEQKDLFDGVYRDAKGRLFSAKKSIIKERAKDGEEVRRMGQRELNQRFESGQLVYLPGNPEAHALALAAKGNKIEGITSREITHKTGVPPTSGVIQEALRKGLERLRSDKSLQDISMRYRGEDELENSEIARNIARQRLLEMGAIRESDFRDLQASKSSSGSKSRLRTLAEKHGVVDPDSGQLL